MNPTNCTQELLAKVADERMLFTKKYFSQLTNPTTSSRVRYIPRCDEDNGTLGEKDVVEYLPVPQPFQQPGLVDAAHAEANGHGEVADEGTLLHRHILQG